MNGESITIPKATYLGLSIVNFLQENFGGKIFNFFCLSKDYNWWLIKAAYIEHNNSVELNFCRGRVEGRIIPDKCASITFCLDTITSLEEFKKELEK